MRAWRLIQLGDFSPSGRRPSSSMAIAASCRPSARASQTLTSMRSRPPSGMSR
ncbi:MAG: hypothetical protein ACK56F_17950 [bacterium]